MSFLLIQIIKLFSHIFNIDSVEYLFLTGNGNYVDMKPDIVNGATPSDLKSTTGSFFGSGSADDKVQQDHDRLMKLQDELMKMQVKYFK